MTGPRLGLTRAQILAFRRHVGSLDERLPRGRRSLRRAAWAGLQDSVPRAALHSIHARVEATEPSTWEDSSLVQLWGPRYSARCRVRPETSRRSRSGDCRTRVLGRRRAESLAARLHVLGGARMRYDEAGVALGVHPNSLRYAAATGTVLIRWEVPGFRRSGPCRHLTSIRMDARLELARRYLHVFGRAHPRRSFGGRESDGGRASLHSMRSASR